MNVQLDNLRLAASAGQASAASLGEAWQDTRAIPPFSFPFAPASNRSTSAKRKWRRPTTLTLIWASQIALCLLVATATTLLVLQLRASAFQQADHELRRLSLILADQAERSFEAVDLVQTTFLEIAQAENIKTPEAFRERMASSAVNKELHDHGSALPQLDVIGLVGSDGMFINVSRHWPVPAISVADRPYFTTLRDDHTQTTFVSEPIVNRLTQTMAVVIAHRVSAPDGRFLGISFAGVLMSYFANLYATVTDGPEMSIALFRGDGMLLAHYPRSDLDVGRTFVRRGIAARLAETGADSDAMQVTSMDDGQQRWVAGHTLAHYPMLVAVSTTISSILEPWRKQSAYLIGLAVLLELVMTAVGVLVHRHLRSQGMLAEARGAQVEAEAAQRGAEAEVAMAHERERAGRDMRVQHLRFGAALTNMSQAVCMFDAAGSLVVANQRLEELFGLPPIAATDGLTVNGMRALLASESNLKSTDVRSMFAFVAKLRSAGKRAAFIRELSDGRSLAVNFAPVEDDGWMVTMEDITERRTAEARIAHMAHHDALTGLPNRALFHDRLAEAVARGQRGEISAILFLDLDHFKAVNDTLGHPVGDELLKEVTQRLLCQVRATDTVARLGGDEFAIVQSGIDDPGQATLLATRVIDAISAPFELAGHHVTVGTSIGIAVIPADGEDPDQILKNADLALYRAKADGRGRHRYFEPEMDARVQARRALELDLREALADGEFEVFYQPLINLKTRTVCGFEALLRWRHPERGLVQPSEFIPVAEEIGLIVPLGEWVLRRACADAATWPGNLKVAVNLSPVQFSRRTLVEDVTAALHTSGLEPNRLELEITETVLLEDTDAVLAILSLLRGLGVGIAMDDFGTGYSSLGYLRRFPFSKVKIDRSFIAGLGSGDDCNAIVAAVANLCETLGMTTTAEGVETVDQLKQLAGFNCTEAQGYLFSRPRPAADVAEMCRILGQSGAVDWD